MAKKSGYETAAIADRIKIGKPRTSKRYRKKGNACSRTSSKGNGRKLR